MKDLNLFKNKNSLHFREVFNKIEVLEDLNCDGFLIRSSEKVARSIIASLRDREKLEIRNKKLEKKFLIGIYGGDDVFNRRVIESLKVDYLVSPEALTRFDNLKQRDGGLNHVVAKMAKEKGIKIVVDIRDISGLKGKEKGKRIAKIMQNIRICRKVGCKIRIASLGRRKGEVVDENGRKSFGVSLGMSSGEIRDCIKF